MLRLGCFCAFGLSGFIPAAHHVSIYGLARSLEMMSLFNILGMYGSFGLGVYIYANKIPEKWWPGKFDIWGHSHQIWHILVVLGSLVHLIGIINQYHWWHGNEFQCPVV